MSRIVAWWPLVATVLLGCNAPKPEATATLSTKTEAPQTELTQPVAKVEEPAKPIVAPDMVQKPAKPIVAPDMVQKQAKVKKPTQAIVAPDMVQKPNAVAKPPSL